MYVDWLYIPTILLAIVCVIQGFRALAGGSYNGDHYFKKRRCIYFIVAGFTTKAMISVVLLSSWMLQQHHDDFSDGFNFSWWLFHTFGKLCTLALHNEILRRVTEWRGAIDKYGQDNRKN